MKKKSNTANGDFILNFLVALFGAVVMTSNILSAKMFKAPFLAIVIPAGLMSYPLTFLISNLVNEFFGQKAARRMVFISLITSLVSFLMIGITLKIPGINSLESEAFQITMGLSGLRILSSGLAFLGGHLTDIYLYNFIREKTRERHLWIRSNGSTLFSQLIDTILIDLIFLYWGLGIKLYIVLGTMIFSFLYKSLCSVMTTPLFYVLVHLLRIKNQSTKSTLLQKE